MYPKPTIPPPHAEMVWNQYTGEWDDASGIQTDDELFMLMLPLKGKPCKMTRCPPKLKTAADKPPGWNQNWKWHSSPRAKSGSDGWRWRDPQGGEWRRHVPDKHHPEVHWDYNPNSQWNSCSYSIDNNGNLLLFTSP
jgi:hypothetical protein